MPRTDCRQKDRRRTASCTAPSPARSKSRSPPRFLPDRSSPENGYFFWAYTITLTNRGGETVQLKTRHWRITDANGKLQEVRGAGVVGEQPVLKPGGNYEYTSGVPLPTPSGFMTGSYGMVTETGEPFDIEIPAFSLDMPQGAAHHQLSGLSAVGSSADALPSSLSGSNT